MLAADEVGVSQLVVDAIYLSRISTTTSDKYHTLDGLPCCKSRGNQKGEQYPKAKCSPISFVQRFVLLFIGSGTLSLVDVGPSLYSLEYFVLCA